MCGIAGLVLSPGAPPPDPVVISRLIDSLRHRGPDGTGHIVVGRVALLHNRLAIIDLVTGDQPFFAGSAKVESVLRGKEGSWAGLKSTVAFQWLRCNAEGASCENISGATSSNYEVGAEDIGHTIRLQGTATNAVGSDTAISAEPSGVVPGPINEVPPAISGLAEDCKASPMAQVFEDVYETYKRQTGGSGPPRNLTPLERSAQTAASEAVTHLERRMTGLATIASSTVYVGLFGTVVGIIDAFHGLGSAGAATLRAVAPGISEALITTAAGLFVAIPALVAYNQLTARIRVFAAATDDFCRELLTALRAGAGR